MERLVGIVEKFDFVKFGKGITMTKLKRQNQKVIVSSSGIVFYDSNVPYGPPHLGTRTAEWPAEVTAQDDFERIFGNTVGV